MCVCGVCEKVIIIQPQAPSSTEGSPGAHTNVPSQDAPLAPTSPSQKKDEDPEVRRHAADRSDDLPTTNQETH